ncbi:MAG: TolC family protein [Vicinamibacterales bacterium]
MTLRLLRLSAPLLVAISSMLVAHPCGAQPRESSPLRLTLDEAVARAIAASNRVAEARARGDAAGAAVGVRHAATLPQITAQAGYTRTNHIDEFGIQLPNNTFRVIYPDIPDNYRTRLDVQWPIYTAGRLDALQAAAQQESTAAASDVEAVSVDTRLDATRAFWTLVVARESSRVVDESFARMAAHVRDVRNQVDAGLLPPNDLLTAQAQEARQRMLSIQARSSADVAEADLARLVGAAPGTAIEADAALEPPGDAAGLDALLAEARERRPDRKALEDRREAAELRRQAAAAGGRPTVAVGGGFDYARPNPRIFPRMRDWRHSWDASVNVNWPLFDGGRTKSEAAEATAGVRVALARLSEFDSMLSLEVRQRLSEIASSRAAIEAADVAVRAATEARRVVGERFAAGVATSTDVVDAQVAMLQAQLDRTQAIANARLAEARLNRALGRL